MNLISFEDRLFMGFLCQPKEVYTSFSFTNRNAHHFRCHLLDTLEDEFT